MRCKQMERGGKQRHNPDTQKEETKPKKSGTVLMSAVSTNAGFLASIVIPNRFSKQ